MRQRTFASEGRAARWLTDQGYVYFGHLFDVAADDKVDPPSLQITTWLSNDSKYPRAVLQWADRLTGKWRAALLKDDEDQPDIV